MLSLVPSVGKYAGAHSLLMQPGAEGMPEKMGAVLTFTDVGQL